MKTSSILTITIVLMLAACNQGNKTNNKEENANVVIENISTNDAQTPLKDQFFDVDDDVDWPKPVYALDVNGDTSEIWKYNQRGLLTYHEMFENSEYGMGYDSYTYDGHNMLTSQDSRINTGNTHLSSTSYTYGSKIRVGEGTFNTEGYDFYTVFKSVTYYEDKDYFYDTLCQEYELEQSWSMVEEDYDESDLVLKRCTRKAYETVNGDYRLVKESFYVSKDDEPGKMSLGYTQDYHYNSQGLLTKVTIKHPDGEEHVIEHSYSGNVEDGSIYYLTNSNKDKFTEWSYMEVPFNMAVAVISDLVPEEYLGEIENLSNTMATVKVDDGEQVIVNCYERTGGSWLIVEYWPVNGPENDRLSFYTYRDDETSPDNEFRLPVQVEGMKWSENSLYFPYQGESVEMGNNYILFPIEDGNAIMYEWNGRSFEPQR